MPEERGPRRVGHVVDQVGAGALELSAQLGDFPIALLVDPFGRYQFDLARMRQTVGGSR